MRITPQTQCCISIAARPGNFGATIFNAAFKVLNLDYIYIPRKVEAGDLGKAIDALKNRKLTWTALLLLGLLTIIATQLPYMLKFYVLTR